MIFSFQHSDLTGGENNKIAWGIWQRGTNCQVVYFPLFPYSLFPRNSRTFILSKAGEIEGRCPEFKNPLPLKGRARYQTNREGRGGREKDAHCVWERVYGKWKREALFLLLFWACPSKHMQVGSTGLVGCWRGNITTTNVWTRGVPIDINPKFNRSSKHLWWQFY